MTSPIGFSDAYLLSTLAFKLGKAFTKGRKSAPAEFREVENQLYSLSAALQAFRAESQDAPMSIPVEASSLPRPSHLRDGEAQEILGHVIESCNQTLKHLEAIVEKYSIIGKPKDQDPKKPRFRKWNDNIKHGWKTIWWTTEGGDLATLRSNLTIHTNSLNLLLGVIVKYDPQSPPSRPRGVQTDV
jgi:hypothetical protein